MQRFLSFRRCIDWGWIVCSVAFLAHILTTGFQLSYGFLLLYAIKHLGQDVAMETSELKLQLNYSSHLHGDNAALVFACNCIKVACQGRFSIISSESGEVRENIATRFSEGLLVDSRRKAIRLESP